MLFTAFPLAYQTRRHIEVAGENRLAGPFPQTKGANFAWLQWTDRREAQVIEFAHCALVHCTGRCSYGTLPTSRGLRAIHF
jgi:hypothetical protein